ncbi:MAG: TonB-dependent receptor [Acidobacteria bacterium]|nr:TonB-dependent receptor [Acidobacteriota bacterium]
MRSIRLGLVLAVLSWAPVTLLAQQGTAQLSGKVTDEQGAVLPGVAVLVTNEDTGVYREVVSGQSGSYFVGQLVPGRYKVSAKLEGFAPLERSGLVLQVGNTMNVDLSLKLGGVTETVEVTGQSPLVDTTSTRVGGNIGTVELSTLPAINRNYFAAVALLPGVQFTPSNQMGNDTIVAGGQTAQNTNVSVDGGYNADDALGTSAGAQVRTPLEAIQEFQVVVSMYDAEFGRASGAVVNAVTKSGTNDFRGVVFGYAASNKLTSKDFFVKQGGLPKPQTTKREWGGVVGGPIVKNKAHFFFSLERQVDNPNRSRVFPTRPEYDFSVVEERSNWNTLIRFDHQLTGNHTWAVRWLRETAPQFPVVGTRQTVESFADETDIDQTAVFTLTSVLGNSRVNTVRLARTWEHWWHANTCARAQGEEAVQDQSLCPPQLDHLSFLGQASTELQGPWDSNWQIEDDFSWFIPGKRGDHELKVGARYNYTELRRESQINRNGTFRFNTDLAFDPTNPRTYPERLTIRAPDTFKEFIDNHTVELFAQDKWRVGRNTFSLGLRYDLEVIPLDNADNPLFGSGADYPVDKNNIAPRVGFTRALDEQNRSVVRAGYGIFYNRTILGAIDDVLEFSKFTSSAVVQFPNDAADPGPSRGQFPTDPFLANGPFINTALLHSLYPPGTLVRNRGVVIFDSPNRQTPYAHQLTVGYTRQIGTSMAVSADYVHSANRDLFLARNLNPMLRANTSRTGPITRLDAFGVLGEPYSQQVWVMENSGENNYDALNLQLEKRMANNWSGRVSYSLGYSRGTAENQADKNLFQTQTDLKLGEWYAPSQVDRRHILALSGQVDIPKTLGATVSATLRYMTGAPFTIHDTSIDANQNGELFDPLPAGTYSGSALNALTDVKNDGGRNGAYGPDYSQLDIRAGWHVRTRGSQALNIFLDIFNVTNRANFDNPSGDRRIPATFLVLTNLRGGGGFPRQAQLGVRYQF